MGNLEDGTHGAMSRRICHLQADTWDWNGQRRRYLWSWCSTNLRELVNLAVRQEVRVQNGSAGCQRARRRCQVQSMKSEI